MANEIAYLFDDYIKVADAVITLVCTGGNAEDSNYPISNSFNEQIALTTRTTESSGGAGDAKTDVRYQIDLGATTGTKKLQGFFIGNHNFSGGSIKIYSYTANDFSTGQNLEATIPYRALDTYYRLSSAPANARQYWEFDLSKNGSITSADAYFEFGRVMLYDDVTLLTEIEDFATPRGYGFANIINVTPFGIRYAHKLTEKRERFELNWGERTAANMPSELRTLFENISGNVHPFVFIPSIAATGCYYVYSDDDELTWTEIFGTDSSAYTGEMKLQLIEAVRGKA